MLPIICLHGCASGMFATFSPTQATGSTGLWRLSAVRITGRSSFRRAMRRWPLLKPPGMRSSAARWECVWRPPGRARIHLLNGLYDAKLDHVPVVAIVGQTARSAMGGAYQQEVDLLTLYKDVAGDYLEMVTVPEQLPNVLDRALRIAAAERTVTAVIIPSDVQELEYTP